MRYFLDADICLDLLDTTRPTSKESVAWYEKQKDNQGLELFFSGDNISGFYDILCDGKGLSPHEVVTAINALAEEVTPFYIDHNDFFYANESFKKNEYDDFTDLLMMHSAIRCGCSHFLTYDRKMLTLSHFNLLQLESPEADA